MTIAVRFDIWDEVECNSGSMLGTLPGIRVARITQSVAGQDTLKLELLRSSPGWTLLQEHRIVRINYDDATPWDEYRIITIDERLNEAGELLGSITCDGIIMDLLTRGGLCERIEANGLAQLHFEVYGRPPTDHVDIILGAFAPFTSGAPSYFSKGTVDPTEPVDMIYDWDSPHSAGKELAEVTNTEMWVTRNGVSSYQLHFLNEIGASSPEVLFKVGRNILDVSHESSSAEQATRIYPQGGGAEGEQATIAENGFGVTAIAGTLLTLDESIVAENDQWVGLYLEKIDGSTTAITDSVTPNQIEVASAVGVAVGDIVRLVRNTGGDDLTYVDLPSAQATYGGPTVEPKSKVLARSEPGVNNQVLNGFYNDWREGGFGPAWCVPNDKSLTGGEDDVPVDQPTTWGRMTTNGCIFSDDFSWPYTDDRTPFLNAPWAIAKFYSDEFDAIDEDQTTYRFGPLGEWRYDTAGKCWPRHQGMAVLDYALGYRNELVGEVDVTLQGGISPDQYWWYHIAGLYLRLQDEQNWYFAGITNSAGNLRFEIIKSVAGTQTILDTYNMADVVTTYTIKFRVADSIQEAWIDGANKISATDTAFDGTPGNAGMWGATRFGVDDKTEGVLFDNFDLVGGNSIIVSSLPTGYKIRACSITVVESGGTATIDLGGGSLRCGDLEVLNGADVVQETWGASVCGGTAITNLTIT